MFVADSLNRRIRKMTRATESSLWITSTVYTVAGQASAGTTDGIGTNALFTDPTALALSADELVLVIAETQVGTIRLLVRGGAAMPWNQGRVKTVTETPGLLAPTSLFIDPSGGSVLVVDQTQSRLFQLPYLLDSCVTCAEDNVTLPPNTTFYLGCAYRDPLPPPRTAPGPAPSALTL